MGGGLDLDAVVASARAQRELAELRTELAAARAEIERLRSPWQPIETAPKDGTPVLLWRDGACFVGWFDVPDGCECWAPLPEPPR